jgi:hypothetical protein
MTDKDIAQLIIKCVQHKMDTSNFKLRDDNWYQLSVAFKFDMQDGKITNLDIEQPKLFKTTKKIVKK